MYAFVGWISNKSPITNGFHPLVSIFVIADVKHGTAAMHMNGKVEFLELKSLDYTISEKEKFFEEAWKDFYKAIAIDERRNENLMISNMPKRYWRYLIEK